MTWIEGLTQLDGGVLDRLGAVEVVHIYSCKELRWLWESSAEASKKLVNLRELQVNDCRELVCMGKTKEVDMGNQLSSLRHLHISCCMRLERYDCTDGIENLEIIHCPLATPALTRPTALKTLEIYGSPKLDESWLHDNSSSSPLEKLNIQNWENLRSVPQACFIHLTELRIDDCHGIESIPESGCGFLPLLGLRQLTIINCKNLKRIPDEQLQLLTSLIGLSISDCPSMEESFPGGVWPPNLQELLIGGLKKPISEWGSQNFPTSLVGLELHGEESGVVSFAEAEAEAGSSSTTPSPLLLPPSLTRLVLVGFEDLERVSKGLQHLTSLEHLHIHNCPKLRDLPLLPTSLEHLYIYNCPKLRDLPLLPTSLEELRIYDCPKLSDLPHTLLPGLSELLIDGCPKLKEKCSERRNNYWPLIFQIPNLRIR